MMTPAAFARYMKALPAKLEKAIIAAETVTRQEATAEAIKQSSGTITTATLRAIRPGKYSTRRGAQSDDNIINAQTGRLRASWVSAGPKKSGTAIVTRICNTSPEAKFLETGTTRMRKRPLSDAVKARVAGAREKRLRQAVRDALRP